MYNYEDNDVQLLIKPKFNAIYFLLCLRIEKFICLFVSLMLNVVILLSLGIEPEFLPSLAISLVYYLIWLCFWIRVQKKRLKETKYEFYKKRVSNYEQMINTNNKPDIDYKDIRICKNKRTILGRILGFGEIQLFIKSTTNGIAPVYFPFVENSEDVYKQITQLLEESCKINNINKFEIQSTFKWGYQILNAIIFSIILTVFIYLLEGTAPTEWYSNVFIIILIIRLVKMFFDKKRYKKSNYTFLETKLKYTTNFSDEEVLYKNIVNITSTQNFLEKIFGLSQIKLYTDTPIRISLNSESVCAYTIPNVTYSEEKIEIIKKIIEQSNEQ